MVTHTKHDLTHEFCKFFVTTGRKEEVEYYFVTVDKDSAMARAEASKVGSRFLVHHPWAAMRATIAAGNADGSVEGLVRETEG